MSERIFIDNVSDVLRMSNSRRSFLRTLVLGSAGAAFSSIPSFRDVQAAPAVDGMSRVTLVNGSDRRDMVYQALKPFENEVRDAIRGKQVVIKPNMVGNEGQLCATHPDALRAILDFLKPIYQRQVIIAESTGRQYDDMPGTIKHFTIYNYFPLEREYNVKLVDLNAGTYTVQWLLGADGRPWDIRVIDDFLNPDNYFISACRLKTHNCLVATVSAKNMFMASPIVDKTRHDKSRMHTPGNKKLNFNGFLLLQKFAPDLAVVDGFEGMEGNGPTGGTPVEHRVALASTDFLAADRIGTMLMGIDFGNIGYLTYCANAGLGNANLNKIEIIGPNPAQFIKPYRMHDNYDDDVQDGQLSWKDDSL